jgi:hypothetical protein
MKKLLVVLTLTLSFSNAFATAQWGTINCSDITMKDLDLMSAMMKKSAQFEKALVAESVRLVSKGNIDLTIENSRHDLNIRIHEEQIAHSDFALACINEKKEEIRVKYQKEIERINKM